MIILVTLRLGGERNFASWQKYLWFSFLKHILSMQVPLWNKTAISSCTEFMDKKIHAQLSESHCKDLFLYEINFSWFLISAKLSLELSMNGCRKAKVIITRNIEYNSKIKIFLQEILALLKSIHVKNFIEKNFLIWYKGDGWKTHTHTHLPPSLSLETAAPNRVKYLSWKLYQRTLQGGRWVRFYFKLGVLEETA